MHPHRMVVVVALTEQLLPRRSGMNIKKILTGILFGITVIIGFVGWVLAGEFGREFSRWLMQASLVPIAQEVVEKIRSQVPIKLDDDTTIRWASLEKSWLGYPIVVIDHVVTSRDVFPVPSHLRYKILQKHCERTQKT